ncbi:MAG: ABC transporter substrate-binding protein, partial [Acidobacteria bacterium]|nr:ABC transporter substrate-binding protein [Acidobacteriota bacterium]
WIGIAGAALAGCSRQKTSATAGTIRVSAQPYLSMCGLYLARELGYFAREGVEVELQEGLNSVQAIPLLAGGRLDVSFLGLSPSLVNAVARGALVRIAAGREIASPSCGEAGFLYARVEAFPHGLSALKELKGKRIACTGKASIGEFCLDTILGGTGLDAADVDVILLRRNDAVAALAAGKIDALVGFDFAQTLAFRSPRIVRHIGLAGILPNFQYSYVCFGEKLIQADPEPGARFLRAYLRGAREFVAGRTPAFLEKFARANGLDPKAAREACRETVAVDGAVNLDSVQRFVAWGVRKGYCPRLLQPSELVDARFLARSAREVRG